jgi:hypothetical protein
MNRRRLLISFIASALVALSAAGPVAAEQSCVGWFASTFASDSGQAFATEISGSAHTERPFGRNVVGPFAHVALEDCQGGE